MGPYFQFSIIRPLRNRIGAVIRERSQHTSEQRERDERNCAGAQKGSSGTLAPSLPVGAAIKERSQHASEQRERNERNCAGAQKGSSGTLAPSLPVGAVISPYF